MAQYEGFQIEKTVGYVVNRAALAIKTDLVRRFKEARVDDVTPETWIILNRLWEKAGLSQNELADLTIKDKTTVTRILSRMMRTKLVRRIKDKTDSRLNRLYPTDKANRLKVKLIPIAKVVLEEATKDIKQQDLMVAIQVLKQIEKNLSPLNENLRGKNV